MSAPVPSPLKSVSTELQAHLPVKQNNTCAVISPPPPPLISSPSYRPIYL